MKAQTIVLVSALFTLAILAYICYTNLVVIQQPYFVDSVITEAR